jgi:hypothetical protein
LSIGAGLSLATIVALWIWETACRRKRAWLYFLFCLWTAMLVAVNLKGIAIFPSLYIIGIPGVVGYTFLKFRRHKETSGSGKKSVLIQHLVCIAALAVIWASQAGSGMFLNIRDNLLLTNPVGMKVNDFYYRYTHYSAEVITTLQQKLFKTYRRNVDSAPAFVHRLDHVFADQGYFLLSDGGPADIRVMREKDQLVFDAGGKHAVLAIPSTDFFKAPWTSLKTLSKKLDDLVLFRRMIFFSLLIAFPITLYWMLHAAVSSGLSLLVSAQKAAALSVLFCFVLGTCLVVPVYLGRDRKLSQDRLAAALASRAWRDQVSALKVITRNNLEIFRIGPYRQLLQSPHVPVQYWLAQALGQSRHAQTYRDLKTLLNASHPNVVCQALAGIGKRGNAQDIPIILHLIEQSNHWYVLRYAYPALRNLGWKQKISG